MVGLVAVIDNDDVVLNMGKKKIEYMKEHFPEQRLISGIMPYDCSRTALVPIIGQEFYDHMNGVVKRRDSTLSMVPFEGAINGIKTLAEMYKIHVLSTRTPEETEYAKERLDMLGLAKYFAGISSTEDATYNNIPVVSGKKKVDVALYLGACSLTDDDKRHMPVDEISGLQCYLFGQGERKNIAPHIIIVRNWAELVARHQELAHMQTP